MTRHVAEILEQAQREGWPTSSIDAMANHHLCGGLARDYVNRCFADPEPGTTGSETGQAGPKGGHSPSPRQGLCPPPPHIEGTLMGRPTPEELQQLRDAIAWQKANGEDTGVQERIYEIGVEQAGSSDD